MTKKEIKALKKEITQHSASWVGYYHSIFEAVDTMELIHTIKDMGLDGVHLLDNTDWQDFVITEYIRNISYQTFKKLAPHFFGYSA